MTTGIPVLNPIPIFTDNTGRPAAGGSVLTQVASVNAPTYSDVGLTTPLPNPIPLNSRGEASVSAGTSTQVFLPPNTVYAFTVKDAAGNTVSSASYVNGVQLTGENMAASLNSITDNPVLASLVRAPSEIAAAITPVNYAYPLGHLWRYGGVGDGVTDNTIAINAWAKVGRQNIALYAPAGTYLHGAVNWRASDGSPSSMAPEIYGDGRNTIFMAKPGLTAGTTLINCSTDTTGAHLHDFTVDCGGQDITGLDTSFATIGPSQQNHYTNIWVQNYAATIASRPGWLATNNNDSPFDRVCCRTSVANATVGLSLLASGGSVQLKDTIVSGSYLYIGAQNLRIQGGFQQGIQFASGCENIIALDGVYVYAVAQLGACLATQALTAGTKIESLTATGCWFDMTVGSAAVLKARIAAGVRLQGCEFAQPGASCTLLSASSVPDLIVPSGLSVPITLDNCRNSGTALSTTYPTGFVVYRNAYDDGGTLRNDTSGSFVPSLFFGGANVGMTYTTNAGRYSIINGLCFLEAEVVVSALGSSTGSCLIGLPIGVPVNSAAPDHALFAEYENITFSGVPFASTGLSGTALALKYQASGAGATQLLNTSFGGGGPWTVRVQGFYGTA